MSVPLLLLDVDGVLNALTDEVGAVWPQSRAGTAVADGRAWPIRWAPGAVERLRDWHEQGRVELQWLTTWGHDANVTLRRLLGLPELRVAGTHDEDPGHDDTAGDEESALGDAHAGHAPSAPDPLTGHWWKYDVVRRVQREEPDRLVVWVDDELRRDTPFRRWAEQQQHLTAVGPDAALGLTPDDLDRIAALLPG